MLLGNFGIIVPIKYMPIISAVGLFCFDKFEETPNDKVVNFTLDGMPILIAAHSKSTLIISIVALK